MNVMRVCVCVMLSLGNECPLCEEGYAFELTLLLRLISLRMKMKRNVGEVKRMENGTENVRKVKVERKNGKRSGS